MAAEYQVGRVKLRAGKQGTVGLSILHEKLGAEAMITAGEAMRLVEAVLAILEGSE